MGLLEGRVAIVTGAASRRGIGREIAGFFAREGASVAIADIDGEGAAETVGGLDAPAGATHRSYVCDVTDGDSVREAVSRVAEEIGPPSILVNNSGITQPKRLDEISPEDYDAVLDVSLRGSFLVSQAVVPHMRAFGEGSLIFISSVSAERGGGVFGGPHYSAAKAGMLGLMRALARDFAPEGIRSNAVAPGFIDTDITAGKLGEDQRVAVRASIPLGREGTPTDVARVCLFLASEMSGYVTGEVIDVNGGMHIY